MLDPDKIKPLGHTVLVKAASSPHLTSSGLIDPNVSRYPNLGWVERAGPLADPSLSPGSYILIEPEGELIEGVPVDFFLLIAEGTDGLEKIALPIEEEPRLRELVRMAHANSDLDRRIQVCDIFTDETWTMMLTDIKHFELAEVPQPGLRLDYINSHMLWLPQGLYYLVDDRRIEAIIHY